MELQSAREAMEDRRRLVRNAEQFEQSNREEVRRARWAARELRDARRVQVEEREASRRKARVLQMEEEILEVERLTALDRAEA